MKKNRITTIILLSISILSLILLYTPISAEARSGCCSHHGGVCGCRCCDGTPLSAKCAPYYPSCNSENPTYKQKYNSDAASSEQVATQDIKINKASTNNISQIEKKEVVYVGSANSNKYHYPWCKWAKKISSYNLVTFNSVKEAKSKGYVPCKVCRPPAEDK